MVTWSVTLSPSPSFAVNERTASVLTSAALVHVIVAIAVLMFATVPLKAIELSATPSPEQDPQLKSSPLTEARLNVPPWVEEIDIKSRDVSSTSAIVEPVIVLATSSSVVTSAAETDHVGTSFAAANDVVITAAPLDVAPSCTV